MICSYSVFLYILWPYNSMCLVVSSSALGKLYKNAGVTFLYLHLYSTCQRK